MILSNPHWSPSPRLQLLRKNTNFLHVTWVTNNGRAWERGRVVGGGVRRGHCLTDPMHFI